MNLLESVAVAATSPQGQTLENVRGQTHFGCSSVTIVSDIGLTPSCFVPAWILQFTLANTILERFQNDARAWTRVPTILQHAQHPQTKRFALTVMENLVRYRWNSLPADQQVNIREYMISYVMEFSASPELLADSRLILDKANGVVVSVRYLFTSEKTTKKCHSWQKRTTAKNPPKREERNGAFFWREKRETRTDKFFSSFLVFFSFFPVFHTSVGSMPCLCE